jgi:hypothetical protein
MTPNDRGTWWGLPLDAWAAAREQARACLVACAGARETIAYSELCEQITVARFKPYHRSLMALLDEVCEEEDAVTGAVLATLVVRRDTGRPGDGYYSWAARGGDAILDREAYWCAQAESVWDAYDR